MGENNIRQIVIFGTGRGGQHLYNQCKNRNDIEVVAFLDNHKTGSIDGICIYHPSDFICKHSLNEYEYYITAGAQKTVKIMQNILEKAGIRNTYLLYDIAGKNEYPLFEDGEMNYRWIHKIRYDERRPTIHYVEYPITDLCNLNCRGCIFGCNSSQTDNKHVPVEQIIKDIRRIAELFCDIPWIRILGGEPLMHPGILEILHVARRAFPESEIDLCTNGLLVPELDEFILQQMNQLNVSVHISGYPPIEKIEDKINERLSQFNIPYTYLKRSEFFKFYTLEPTHQMDLNYDMCPTSGCWEVYRGKIMRCSGAIAFKKLNKQFGTDYQVINNIDWFSIHDEQIDGFKLKEELCHASAICKYCDLERMKIFEWGSGGNPKLEDYTV